MVTVILCSYNGAQYIKEQVDSILGQLPSGSFLRVYDDASTDGTADILESCRRSFPDRFAYTVRTEPTGSAARNFLTAMREAPDSDYYMLSDQDDVWHEDKLSRLLTEIRLREKKEGARTPLLVHSDAAVVDTDRRLIHPSFIRFEGLSPERTDLNHQLIQNQVTGGACIFNRALMALVRGTAFPERARVHDHWLAILAAAFGRIFFVPEALYDYRQHPGNQIGAKKASFLGETLRRLGLGRESKAEIDAVTRAEFLGIYAQGEEFLRLFGDRLSPQQRRAVEAFTRLDSMSKFGKIRTILRYGFTFNKFYRTVGECIFI